MTVEKSERWSVHITTKTQKDTLSGLDTETQLLFFKNENEARIAFDEVHKNAKFPIIEIGLFHNKAEKIKIDKR